MSLSAIDAEHPSPRSSNETREDRTRRQLPDVDAATPSAVATDGSIYVGNDRATVAFQQGNPFNNIVRSAPTNRRI